MKNLSAKFEEVAVWQAEQDLVVRVFQDMAKVRDFSFADQIMRPSVADSNNIAEGAERRTPTDFARFLYIAKGSAGEVRSMYYFALRLGLIKEDDLVIRIDFANRLPGNWEHSPNTCDPDKSAISPFVICDQSYVIFHH